MAKYHIKQGNHYHGISFWLTTTDHLTFTVTFDESCLYQLPPLNGYDSNYDINKLYGFATTYNHHDQSARIGWRCRDGKNIEVMTYTYNNHVRDAEDTVLGVVKPGEPFHCSITDKETYYLFAFTQADLTTKVVKPKRPDKVLFKYILFPYFGGNSLAPHDMSLSIVND